MNLTFQASPVGGTSGSTIGNTGSLLSLDQPDINSGNDNSTVDVEVRNDADLEITQAVSSTLPRETETVTYTLTVTNNGPSVSRDVVIENLVPAGLTYVPGSIAGADLRNDSSPAAGSGLTWTITEILNGASVTLTFDVTVDPGTFGQTISTTSNIASFTSTESDPSNNSSSIDITVDNSLDLFIGKTVDNVNPVEGDTLTYTVTVTNNGPGTRATNIALTDVVPAGITYVPGSITGGTASNDADPSGVGLSWTLAQLDPTQSAVLTFQATVDSRTADSTILNTLSNISLDQVDSNATPDDLTESIDVQNVIDLQLIKTVSDATPALLSEDIVYTLTLTNNGPSVAENVQVTDVVPNLLVYSPGSISGGDIRNDASPNTTVKPVVFGLASFLMSPPLMLPGL